ncbi:hypothetical protein CAMSH0001_1525 [Campylobacter showae RM3277]|uniref:Uncharacterized protein n=1 Tax=Campylobacter showae RM3277 TaxID=553219 RepID=C6RCT9_9BACT|nr:hypothetical protein CAMSH0001_1525 [Campylobacter showae RM3277]
MTADKLKFDSHAPSNLQNHTSPKRIYRRQATKFCFKFYRRFIKTRAEQI